MGFYLDTLEDELLSIVTSLQPPNPKVVEEHEEDPAVQSNGWLEVGKRNKSVVTRSVSVFLPPVCRDTECFVQTKSAESPITRLFGGKFRSTLRAPHQRDSVTVEDWRSLRLDISVRSTHCSHGLSSILNNPFHHSENK